VSDERFLGDELAETALTRMTRSKAQALADESRWGGERLLDLVSHPERFLNAVLLGRTLGEVRGVVSAEIAKRRAELDALSQRLIEDGVAVWSQDGEAGRERLIVRGRAHLLEASEDAADLDRIRQLFDDLERKRDLAQLLDLTEGGEGVRVFIGAENKLFSLSGSALVVSPYMSADRRIIGAVGVIGPTRLNYGRIVPIVDYTAQLVGRLVSDRTRG